jgi:hypothetical protein
MHAAKPAQLAGPIEIVGWPPVAWGHPKYFNIRLNLFQSPGQQTYVGTLLGTPDFFTELGDLLDRDGEIAVSNAIKVRCADNMLACASCCFPDLNSEQQQ